MKTALFYTVLMLLAFGLKAQTLEIPQIISVSVDTVTGYPIVNWKLENPQETDGVVIKRLIIGGQGVISGTYNTVAQTNDNSVFSYCDSKEAYGTKPQAENRKEFYRVAAYKNKDGKPIYSLMSDEVSTQSFSGSFDYCTNTFNFEFSPNKEYGAKIMH